MSTSAPTSIEVAEVTVNELEPELEEATLEANCW